MASSDSGVSNTIYPMAITSDDKIATDPEVHTSDTTSTDEDDFQTFALPDLGDDLPLADGPQGEDLPLVLIPAPLPFAAVPFEEQPLDTLPDGDIDLLIEGPPEGDQDGGAPMEDDVPLADVPVVDPVVPMVEIPGADDLVVPPFEAPVVEALPDPSISYPLKPEVEFIPVEPAPADLELGVVPEPVFAPDPILVDAPVVAPPVTDAPVVAPPAAEVQVVAPIPDPMPMFNDLAPFATHIDPRYADTRNGWIEDDDYPPFILPVTPPAAPISAPVDIPLIHPHVFDTHRTDLPTTFLHDIPPPRPGEGPSTGPHGHMPPLTAAFPYIPPFAPTTHTAFTSTAPTGEPFMWSSPNVMPLSDPYQPFHVGYTTDDILISLQLQQDALSRRVQELERILYPPPCRCQSPFATPPTPLGLHPDSDVHFLTRDQQIAYLLRVVHALEEDLAHLRRLVLTPPPPPPPPSA
ncbi:proline-rich extensin-like protein EPR1 [Helianthus annuus]|uniref:proline-rich extensin-like protein EPR1 n=1 Tax=Helianthus annuus TaxID=4232 RepID=UPI000B8F6D3E|nr:proline-rich extensin-like protein EPR1 [Helianthus annuus]